jgi:Tol biopolymer transport system component
MKHNVHSLWQLIHKATLSITFLASASLSFSASGLEVNPSSLSEIVHYGSSDDGNIILLGGFLQQGNEAESTHYFDLFAFDRATEKLTLISQGEGEQSSGQGHSTSAIITPDGRWIAFESGAPNLVSNDRNQTTDVFLYDRQSRKIDLVSRSADRSDAADGSSRLGDLSSDGRYITFISNASDLGLNQTQTHFALYRRDQLQNQTDSISQRTYPSPSHTGFVGLTDRGVLETSTDQSGTLVAFRTELFDGLASSRTYPHRTSTEIFVTDTRTQVTSWVSALARDTLIASLPDLKIDSRKRFQSYQHQLSKDGRYLYHLTDFTFNTESDPRRRTGRALLRYDRESNQSQLVSSQIANGNPAINDAASYDISDDGRIAVFARNRDREDGSSWVDVLTWTDTEGTRSLLGNQTSELFTPLTSAIQLSLSSDGELATFLGSIGPSPERQSIFISSHTSTAPAALATHSANNYYGAPKFLGNRTELIIDQINTFPGSRNHFEPVTFSNGDLRPRSLFSLPADNKPALQVLLTPEGTTLTWHVQEGTRDTIEATSSIANPAWQPITTEHIKDGDSATLRLKSSTPAQQFFRLVRTQE